ncbi:MAG TPA: prepilin-type N-terminal cleavage/methylation domain-containing protein [Anaerohalosphaeraceae bacterium]|nr:prepilin-type N-terminal cleavage/methylation domain-containing protein [Anaerohalosphaeraceae bacterium]
MRKATKGFTLIELLVVISIIALLMGIIVPALSRVKLSAQTLICSTNLKNYGTALQGYA